MARQGKREHFARCIREVVNPPTHDSEDAMTTTNYQRVTEGLQTLTAVLAPYVARELRAKLADWGSSTCSTRASGATCRRPARTTR